jgi:streptogramin lyase
MSRLLTTGIIQQQRNLYVPPLPTFPDWSDDSNKYTEFLSSFQSEWSTPITNFTPSYTIHNYSGGGKYLGSAIAPNGKIYCGEGGSGNILVIDTNNNTSYTISALQSGLNHLGCVLAPNGFIYMVALSKKVVTKINPTNDQVTEITHNFNGTWRGLNVANNGKLYASPSGGNNILTIDTLNGDVISTFGNNISGSALYNFGCLVNDTIYFSPLDAANILAINTLNDTYYTIPTISGTLKWGDLVLGHDENVYGIPYGNRYILKLTTSNEQVSYIDTGDSSNIDMFYKGTPANDGHIYATPFIRGLNQGQQLLKIDPINGTFTTLFSGIAGAKRYTGIVLAQNGKLYLTPREGGQYISVNIGNQGTLNSDAILSRHRI